jgi:hypothetical protein
MLKKLTDELESKPWIYALLFGAHLFITSLTWRDLRRRRPDQVRGSKRVWRLASAANMSNSLAYFTFGRRSR